MLQRVARSAQANAMALACAVACSVKKAYDQTGNGHHAIQATLAQMPLMAFSIVNGHQTMYLGNVTLTEHNALTL